MTKSVPSSALRRSSGPSARAGGRGFSLVELLAVIAILGIIAIIGGQSILKAWQRQKLQSAAEDIKVFLQRAITESQRANVPVFVLFGSASTGGSYKYLPIYLLADANQDGILQFGATACRVFAPCPDYLIDELDVPISGNAHGYIGVVGRTIAGATQGDQELSFSVDDVTKVQSNLWTDQAGPCPVAQQPFCDPDARARSRALMVDFQGRAIGTTHGSGFGTPYAFSTGRQLAGPALLVLTHVNVVNGAFLPPTRYVIRVNPVWSVSVVKQIKDATGTWVDQQGS